MKESFSIGGYCRISVDEELDRENTSIENQKAIIEDFVKQRFPDASLTFFTDRDRSGYTFEQREGYQVLRRELLAHHLDILIIKDFSRFSRRNSRGLVELEDLRDAGVRIISIGDNVDFPGDDDWLKIQFQFLINEMPVTDASKKVRSVIRRRQSDGKWICAVPYGYIIRNGKTIEVEIEDTAAETVRTVFDLYNAGWGYKKIAGHLTELHIPTPRTAERVRREAQGEECRRRVRPEWSIATIEGILCNDFYIGTLRQGKYGRKKINGANIKRNESEQIVFEDHHQPIINSRCFALAQEQRRKRSKINYRGIRINDNVYSGFLFCGDCGSPMFAMGRRDLRPAYLCGSYHKRGLAGCTSHHTRVDVLDKLLKLYLARIREGSAEMLEQLQSALCDESEKEDAGNVDAVDALNKQAAELLEDFKATKRQKIRDIARNPGQTEWIEETYDELEAELTTRIEGVRNQLIIAEDRVHAFGRAKRTAQTALELFDAVLRKEKLDKRDVELLIERIAIFEDHMEIKLRQDIDALLPLAALTKEKDGPLPPDSLLQTSARRPDKILPVHVVSEGDPLEIYTEKDGEVIFKKYSPMGELSEFASQICDSLHKATNCVTVVCDRDSVIAVSGASKRELAEKRVSAEVEQIMEARSVYRPEQGAPALPLVEGDPKYIISVAAPILSEGDILGCIAFVAPPNSPPAGDLEFKLAQTVACFLGRQLES